MWWWESVGWGSRTECGTRAHVDGDQDSFLGLAVMQVCGTRFFLRLATAHMCGGWVIMLSGALATYLWDQLIPGAHNSWAGVCLFFAAVK